MTATEESFSASTGEYPVYARRTALRPRLDLFTIEHDWERWLRCGTG